ncbi:tetratricopeptide (TPR) repeat protein [Lipingzhangella halophila]|uniref:Tetratricopeptide (TPR) repeat protein n=1 Tax=Lipingzhangella halophila TaxID=1783352 RepID=A0A7W7W598_9ACTN|nr:RDD family protein [Lipingzhangella halophila]MBB4934483.1 tetratricopeptide (TPR) repeat protein [Lipingzhangella halophila]
MVNDAIKRAQTRLAIGKPQEALRIVEQALATDPDHPILWEMKGRAHLRANQYQAAIAACQRSIGLDGGRPSAYICLAMALLDNGQAVDMLDAGEAVLRLNPENDRGHMIVALARAARYQKGLRRDLLAQGARDAANRALELAPEDSWLQGQAGQVHHLLGDRRTATRHYREAVRLAPEDTWALTKLAVVQSQRWRKIEALRYLRTVLAIDPRDFTVLQAVYTQCREFTRSLIAISAFLGFFSIIMVIAEADEPNAVTLRLGFSVITTACLGYALFRIWRVPVSMRRFLVNRKWGRVWAGSVLLPPLAVLAISWLPLPYAAAAIPLLVVAVFAYLILTGVVDRDALARFAAGEFPEAERQRSRAAHSAPAQPPVAADPGTRLGAFLVDGFVAGALGLVAFYLTMFATMGIVFGLSLPDGPVSLWIGMGSAAVCGLTAVFCYFWLSTANTGQTVGKRAMSIRTVDLATGNPPSRKAAAGRTALLFGFALLPVVGFLADLVVMLRDHPHYRGARDELAKTWVIQA